MPVHVEIDAEKGEVTPPTDRRGLVASFVILLLSVPALIGA